ncbi:MAG: CAAD domain-containing protein [Vulcanococcus sp.]
MNPADPTPADAELAEAPPVLELHLAEETPGPLQPPAPASGDNASPQGAGVQLGGIRELLQQLGVFQSQSMEQLLPALQILGLAVVAGVGLKLTGAVLGAINELPLLGQLLQLVGLVTAVQFLARNALQQQKRAALLARIAQIKTNLLG